VRRKTLGLLALPLLLACSSPEERAEQARSEVVEALQRGERGEALEALERLRAIKPDTPHALGQYAALLVRTGEAPQAIWELEAGIARFPESHELRLLLGGVALLVSDPARATSVVEAIPAGSEHHARALVLRARAEIELGDLERGLATLEEAERRHPDAHELRLPRIAALLRDRRHDEARDALDAARALAEDEQDQAVLRNLELALYTAQAADAGGAEAAIAGLRAMLQSRPEDAQAWVALIQVLVRERRAAEALELASAALEDDPDLYGLYGQLARLQASAGRFDDARATLRRFVEKSGSASAYLALAQFSIQQEDADGALAAFEEGLTAHSDDPLLLAGLAEALIGFDRLASARSTLARYRELTPDAPTVEYLRARLELAEGQEDAAIERLRRLLPTRDDVATQYWLGRALEAAGDEDGALKHYQQAVLRNPNEASPYLSLIAMGQRRGDWRLVVFYAQRFLLRAPGRARVWDALILALVQGGELEDAEERARQALELFPRRDRSQLMLAVVLRARGRPAEALEALAAAGRTDSPPVLAERALTLAASGEPERGLAELRTALGTRADSAVLHYALASLLFQIGEAEEASRAVDRALELDPEDLRPLRSRAEFQAAAGRLEGARRDCEAYLEKRPYDAHVHFVLGAVHDQAGRKELAIASYRRAAELDDGAYAPRNNLAALLSERGDVDGALAVAQQAYRLAADDPYVMDTLGALYLEKGLIDRAISILEKAHASAPDLPDAQLHLALAYRANGQKQRAREMLADLRARGDGREDVRAQVDEALATL
jgi:tetratricopeptide (TPR) repeat protein